MILLWIARAWMFGVIVWITASLMNWASDDSDGLARVLFALAIIFVTVWALITVGGGA